MTTPWFIEEKDDTGNGAHFIDTLNIFISVCTHLPEQQTAAISFLPNYQLFYLAE